MQELLANKEAELEIALRENLELKAENERKDKEIERLTKALEDIIEQVQGCKENCARTVEQIAQEQGGE
jgi:hypothetical protein